MPSESNAHWLPWLQKELTIRDVKADTPEVPHSYEPKWDIWCREVERFDITSETILVGHSAGAGFWLKYVSIHSELKVDKVVLVGPWLDPDHTLEEKTFFDFKIDPDLVKRTNGLTVFYAVDDSDSVQTSVKWIRDRVKDIHFREFPRGYGHFTYHNLHSQKFPELRAEILSSE